VTFIPESFGQATLVFTIPGPSGPAMVVFGYDSDLLQGPDADAEDIFDAWTTAGSLFQSQDAQTILTEVRTLVRLGSGELVSGLHTESVPGSQAGEGAPPQVSLLIQKRTGLAGRNRRGRLYMPGAIAPPQTGVYSGTYLTDSQTRADTFLSNLSTASVPMYLLHTSEVDPPNAVVSLNVVATSATQRRRIR